MFKLIKHEWLNVSKTLGFTILYLIVVTFLFTFVSQVDLSGIPFFGNLISILISIIYIISLSAVSLISYISAGVRYSHTMYGDQGYLTQTLPYTKGQLVFAKSLVSSISLILINLAAVGSGMFQVLVLSNNAAVRVFLDTYLDRITLREFSQICREELGVSFSMFLTLLIAFLIVFLVLQMNAVFTSISVGQLWSRHPMVGTVGTYLGGCILYLYLTNKGLELLNGTSVLEEFTPFMIFLILINLVYLVVTYLIPTLLLKYRLNMK